MLQHKFALLVEELESAGAVGHQAYEIANRIDSADINFASQEEIKAIAEEVMQEERICKECISETEG